MISIECRAKINLYLRVTGKRPDGFHDLETLFAEIDLADHLSWQPGNEPASLEVVGASLGDPATNLVIRAAKAFAEAAAIPVGGRFHLKKAIPAGGGLGGGSSDAAGTLLLLNRHFGHRLDEDAMAQVALELGSDVPFFLRGGCCLGQGRGELLADRPLTGLPRGGLLFFPGIALATADVFRALRFRPRPDRRPPTVGENDLLAPALKVSPQFAQIWSRLSTRYKGEPFFMTGSGSTLVLLTERPAKCEAAVLVSEQVSCLPFSFVAG